MSAAGPVLSILIYHRVRPGRDPLFPAAVDADLFNRQMAFLRRCFRVLRLSEAVERMRNGTLPSRAACVTFDDGYADNAEIALPILQHHRIPATFFIATGYLDGGCMWNDEVIEAVRAAAPRLLDLQEHGLGMYSLDTVRQQRLAVRTLIDTIKYYPAQERRRLAREIKQKANALEVRSPMMTTAQVRQLHDAGMEIGAHTVTHPILAACDIARVRQEIIESRRQLEAIVRDRVGLFAYPNGRPGKDYRTEHVELVRALGFGAAVTTAPGAASAATDPFQLPRYTPWHRSLPRFGMSLAANRYKTPVYATT